MYRQSEAGSVTQISVSRVVVYSIRLKALSKLRIFWVWDCFRFVSEQLADAQIFVRPHV